MQEPNRPIVIVQLAASPFFGGAERQMLGLALHLPERYRTVFLGFADKGSGQALHEFRRHGFEALALKHNAPRYGAAVREVAGHLRRLRADVLCCNGYKPDILGWRAARLAGLPVVSIAHGWTGATIKVRLNEVLDRLVLRWMDRVVCVSEGQAVKVRQGGVPPERVTVIRNAIDPAPFSNPEPSYREELQKFFAAPKRRIVAAAGRLSPEKGFGQLVEAAALVRQADATVGFILFGDGPLRGEIAARINQLGLQDHFVLAGFRDDLAKFLPHADVAVLPSFTEGLPVVVLEALAAGVPVVATAVGGTPEVVEDGVNGYLVAPGKPADLAQRILGLLGDDDRRRAMGQRGRQRVLTDFTFAAQSLQYQSLFEDLLRHQSPRGQLVPAAGSNPCRF